MNSGYTTLQILRDLSADQPDFFKHLDQETIRKIKKHLKARVTLNGDITQEEVNTILSIIEKEGNTIATLFQPQNAFYIDIVTHREDFTILDQYNENQVNVNENLITLVDHLFLDEVRQYVTILFENEHYRGVYYFLKLKSALPTYIIAVVENKIEHKLLFFTDHFQKYNEINWVKVEYLFNPYFFRCIQLLDNATIFDVPLSDTLYLMVEKRPFSEELLLAFLFGMGFYSPLNIELENDIQHNKKIAIDNGIEEERSSLKAFKGGVNVHREVHFTDDPRFESKGYLNKAKKYDYKTKNLNNSSVNYGGVIIGIMAAVISISLIFMRKKSKPKFSNYNIEHYRRPQNFTPPPTMNPVILDNYKPNSIILNQYSIAKKRKDFQPLAFNAKNSYRKKPYINANAPRYYFENKTDQNVILVIQTARSNIPLFIKKGSKASIKIKPESFVIYTGEKYGQIKKSESTPPVYGFLVFDNKSTKTIKQILYPVQNVFSYTIADKIDRFTLL